VAQQRSSGSSAAASGTITCWALAAWRASLLIGSFSTICISKACFYRIEHEMPSEVKQFQIDVATNISSIYREDQIVIEWRAIDNTTGIYSPRIDVAIGPFSTIRGDNCIDEYDLLTDETSRFINRLILHHKNNIDRYRMTNDSRIDESLDLPDIQKIKYANRNARCFIAIEVENEVSRKHLLGGAVNAAALGRIGVVVGWTESKLKALIKLQAYWDFLGSVGKNTYRTTNLLILSPDQLLKAINDNE
jgi:hypothetical protein